MIRDHKNTTRRFHYRVTDYIGHRPIGVSLFCLFLLVVFDLMLMWGWV